MHFFAGISSLFVCFGSTLLFSPCFFAHLKVPLSPLPFWLSGGLSILTGIIRKQKTEHDIAPLHTINERRIIDTYPDPSQNIETQERKRVLRTAIQHLPPMHKKVFLLRYVQELPIKKIATLINRSEGTVKTHLSKAHHQLRDLLTPYLRNEDIPWLV